MFGFGSKDDDYDDYGRGYELGLNEDNDDLHFRGNDDFQSGLSEGRKHASDIFESEEDDDDDIF